MAKWLGRVLAGRGGPPPPVGFFASTTGSSTGAGTIGDPWTLTQAVAGGFPTTTVQPGDTVWIRGGTYTGQFDCALEGTAGNPITFRGYPGERVTIDGNFNPAVAGNSQPSWHMHFNNITDKGRYQILRDVEITNSNPHRLVAQDYFVTLNQRGDDVEVSAPYAKLINCFLHNGGEGMFQAASGGGTEIYGNLIYGNGFYANVGEQNQAVSVDLVPAAGIAVATSGSYTANQTGGNPTCTITNHNNTGDYTLVAVGYNSTSYTTLSATYDGTAMALLLGIDGYSKSTAIFGLAGHAGIHNVVVTTSGAETVRAIAQSFVNVGSAAAGGSWKSDFFVAGIPPDGATTATNTNHMVVDGVGLYMAYGTNYTPSGDNAGNLIGHADPIPGGVGSNPIVMMSTATRTGAGNVNMQWNWTMNKQSHGHGMYIQNGGNFSDGVAVAGNATLTTPTNTFRNYDAGANIIVYGAGIAGADLVTTILSFTDYFTVVLAVAPSTSVNPAEVSFSHPRLISDNVILDECNYSIQIYGSSGANGCGIETTGNLHVFNDVVLGGLSGFRLTDSVYHGNYLWNSGLKIGYDMHHMTNFKVQGNYVDNGSTVMVAPTTWEQMVIGGAGNENTFIGTIAGFASTDFPNNTYTYTSPASPPTTNVIVVRPNTYEANRANILVYNWQGLTTVNVDLSAAVAIGTPINIMNAQDYFNTAVYSGTYTGGTVNLPMTGLTVEVPIGGPGGDAGATYPTASLASPAFAAFIVRAKSAETWR